MAFEVPPPANARVLTQRDIEQMEEIIHSVAGHKYRDRLPCYNLKGPILIKGDIRGLELSVVGGGLWVDGNVTDCDIDVMGSGVLKLENRKFEGAWRSSERQIPHAWKQAADAGIGLHINGWVDKCNHIIAPNISIGGNIVAGSNQLTDRENWNWPNRIMALGGWLHVGGTLVGTEESRSLCKTRKYWHTKRVHDFPLREGETVEGKMLEELDLVRATGNVRVARNVNDFGLVSTEGTITVGGKKSGFIITHQEGKTTIEREPGKPAPEQKRSRLF